MDDRSFYQTVLGLADPWVVEQVELRAAEQEVLVRVGVALGAKLRCPECGEVCVGYDRSDERRWRHLDTMQYRTVLVTQIPRVRCNTHGVRQVKVPWAEERGRFTALFEAWAIRLLHESTVLGVAELLGISWEEASSIQRRAVVRGLARRSLEPVAVLGIDETSFQKRYEYVTVINDLEGDRVLWVGDHRRRTTLREYWESRSEAELAAVRAVVMDMWEPYIVATRECVPDALSKIVFDRYHVAVNLSKAVNHVRTAEQRELRRAGEAARAAALQGKRFTLLKGRRRRTPEDEAEIAALRKAGYKVGRAWMIKESAERIWACVGASEAAAEFRKWYSRAMRSRLEPIKRAARLMKGHLYGILRYAEHRYTNAKS